LKTKKVGHKEKEDQLFESAFDKVNGGKVQTNVGTKAGLKPGG